jgi:hypothetical protein
MTKVYVLWHVGPGFEEHGDEEDSKLLGVFSSKERASAWQQDAASLAGFRDAVDRFVLVELTLDERLWPDGFVSVMLPE